MILPKCLKLIPPPPKEIKPLVLLKRKIRAEEAMIVARANLQREVIKAKDRGYSKVEISKIPAVIATKEVYIQSILDLQEIEDEILLRHKEESMFDHESWLRMRLDDIRSM